MNQDSEQNDRRDGNPQERNGRSSGRRDDDRQSTPRFNRDRSRTDNSDRPNYNERPNPRANFNRDRNNDNTSGSRSDDRRPRPDRDRNNNTDRPRFERNSDRSNQNRADNRGESRDNSRPRFERSGDSDRRRPNTGRSDDRRNEGPSRFSRSGDRFDRNSNQDRFGSERRYTDRRENTSRRDDDRPRFNRDDRDRNESGPRGGNDRFGTKPPRRTDRPSDRQDNDRPRFNREGGPREGGPRDGSRSTGEDRPRFPRNDRNSGPSRFNRDDKPAFKRVGGFNRDADERNRFGDDRGDNSRRTNRTNDSFDRSRNREEGSDSRFSADQRKESGERRTGRYNKAPNYNLENARASDSFNRKSKPTTGKFDKPKEPTEPTEPGLTRLNRYIANSGVCSRREADELIARGDISVNGKVVTEMGFKVKEGDTVKYGTKVLNPERFVYVLLNKPKDYITTTDDPEERRTVMELVADAGNFRMYPVGRLDRNTTGLLLLTNDGELADKLTHPSNEIRKIYQVELDKPITNEHFEVIQQGVNLEDGPIKPDALSIVTPDAQVVGIEIHSGRNRIVRRIFESLGYEVTKLDRTVYAGLTKKDLPRGKWRFLEPKEVVKLKYLNA